MKFDLKIFYVGLFVIFSSCEDNETCVYTDDDIDFYIRIATNYEHNSKDVPIVKWEKNPKISIIGTPNEHDTREVQRIIDELNTLQKQITLSVTNRFEQADIILSISEKEEFEENFIWLGLGRNGQFYYALDSSFKLANGVVWVNSELNNQEYRNWLLRHELTQVLGLPNDIKQSSEYSTSIFNEKWVNTEYSELDKLVIQMHYSDIIEHGMTSEEIRNLTCWK